MAADRPAGASGRTVRVRVTPRARRNEVRPAPKGVPAELQVLVTVPPEDGKANKAVIAALSEAFGVAPSRIRFLRGAKARDKLFRID